MPTKWMNWISIAALVVLLMSWRSTGDNLTFVAAWLVCAGALVVLLQAIHAGKYVWAAILFAVAILFNPVVPVMFSPGQFVALNIGCLGIFIASLRLRTTPKLSIASITDRTPGSESL